MEIDADPDDTPALPWELLRDPATNQPLDAVRGEFVRTHRRAARSTPIPAPSGDRLRVLLVICRPGGRGDVPFGSVAARLVRGGTDQIDRLDLD